MIGLLSHRGLVNNDKSVQNSIKAFDESFSFGFGVETDLRDSNKKIVISHDPPPLENELSLKGLVSLFLKSSQPGAKLALNVKSDGLVHLIGDQLNDLKKDQFFFFDMSFPDSLAFVDKGWPIFARISEFEQAMGSKSWYAGVWLDAFKSDWYQIDAVRQMLDEFEFVAIVSPELHGRSYEGLWSMLRDSNLVNNPRISLCTDYPLKAREYFYEQN